MTHTTNYNLNKFEATDRVTRDGFNDNADAIDAALKSVSSAAGNCRLVTGTYTGTGTFGSSNPNSLTFDGKPIFVFIASDDWQFWSFRGSAFSCAANGVNWTRTWLFTTWTANGLSWYGSDLAAWQLNTSGATYTYYAILCDL